ncbi:MAG: peptide chain release factor N(5)-glutamine methyltransferase, partial [Pseudomonadota bacterium]
PVSHIIGKRAFWGRDFRVNRDVLDPRPETETLIARALEQPAARILDLGTGSGCLLLTLLAEWPAATGAGVDVSGRALDMALRNARNLGVEDRAQLVRGSWYAPVEGVFDLIIANPPYLSDQEMGEISPELHHEPRLALSPGGDGLGAYRLIAADLFGYLAKNGRALFEIGTTQGPAVAEILKAAGLSRVSIYPDMDGRDRVVGGLNATDC